MGVLMWNSSPQCALTVWVFCFFFAGDDVDDVAAAVDVV